MNNKEWDNIFLITIIDDGSMLKISNKQHMMASWCDGDSWRKNNVYKVIKFQKKNYKVSLKNNYNKIINMNTFKRIVMFCNNSVSSSVSPLLPDNLWIQYLAINRDTMFLTNILLINRSFCITTKLSKQSNDNINFIYFDIIFEERLFSSSEQLPNRILFSLQKT